MKRKITSAISASVMSIFLLTSALPADSPVYAVETDLYVGYGNISGSYKTVQEAVNKAASIKPASESERVTIHIAPGTYREQIIVNTPYISFVNDSPSEQVLLTWYYGIGYKYYSVGENGYYNSERANSKSQKTDMNQRWGSATALKGNADYFRAENITFENSFNRYVTNEEIADGVQPSGSQSINFDRTAYGADVQSKTATERAAAIAIEGDCSEFYNCKFYSSQDTLFTNGAKGYFKNCLIEGNTDYIFGSGTYVFDNCDLSFKGYSSNAVGGYITAVKSDGKYLFNECDVTANDGLTVNSGYFGRPWGAEADVAFVNTRLEYESIIQPAGWTKMSGNTPENARFKEFGTTAMGKPVNTSQRVSGTVKSSPAGLDIGTYLSGWTPYYMNYTADNKPVENPDNGGNITHSVLDANKTTRGTFTSSFKINDTFSVIANAEKTVEVAEVKVSSADGKHDFSSLIRLGGGGNTAYRSIEIKSAGKGKLNVYMMSSNTAEARTVNLLDSAGNVVSSVENVVDSSLDSYSFNIPSAGIYYLTSATKGLNIAYADLSVTADENVEVTEKYPVGDINNDGVIDVYDLILLRNGIADKFESESARLSADVTGDGKTDKSDLVLMSDYLLGKDVKFGTGNQPDTPDNPQVTPVPSDAVYASPNGNSNGNGTEANPYDIVSAVNKVSQGGTICLSAGTYKLNSTLKINNSGKADDRTTITSYNGEVILDFSAQETGSSNRGVSQNSDYWHWYGIKIQNAGDNGMIVGGSNNIIEMCRFEGNEDTGLQISSTGDIWPADNLILNCTSCNNCDTATMENADGFAAKLTCGEGNVFDGCISYNNSDDGWDLFAKTTTGPIGTVTLRNCVAFRNGFTEDGKGYGDCDGNGFKLGGSGVGSPHVVENCIAFENWHSGFVDNNNPLLYGLKNCTSYNNAMDGGSNFRMYRATNGTYSGLVSYIGKNKAEKDTFNGTISDSVYYHNSTYYKVDGKTAVSSNAVGNQTTSPIDGDFVSLSVPAMGQVDFHKYWRNPDGSVNTKGYLEIKSSSNLYGKGAALN